MQGATHLNSRLLTNTRAHVLLASAALLASGTAFAQHTVEHVTCRAGTLNTLAQADKLIVWQLDHRGVTQAGPGDPFDGFTQRCIGTVANVEGKLAANGWCRNVDPKTGDWTLVNWTGSDKPGHGTYAFQHGTGKWKGISGGGTYEPLGAATKPIEPGTYQNCVRIKGTYKLPG